MAFSISQALTIGAFFTSCLAFVDFGTTTQHLPFDPTFTVAVPRPHQLPDDAWMRYETFYSQITAVAPSMRMLDNGSYSTSWSVHSYITPTRTADRHGSVHRRGVFSGDLPIPTCRQCDKNGNPLDNSGNTNGTGSGAPVCSQFNYDGIFRNGGFASSALPNYCFDSSYGGPLLPSQSAEASLPCCPVCYPPNLNSNSSVVITSGVLSTPGTLSMTTPMTGGGIDPGDTLTITDIITATEPTTITQTTLSIETITPTGAVGSPVINTRLATIKGCGTASGCGTVVGDGTVYLAPFGFPAVTSSGTVIGCAPTVIGCGSMIATQGVFTGTADLTACGEGTGSATMVGSGTVWPAGFFDLISFVSSGTVVGSGRVKGCGYLTGTGTFTISGPYTTTEAVTITPTPTVNVYVSYCPPRGGQGGDLNPLLKLAGNFSGDGARYAGYSPNFAADASNHTQINMTGKLTSMLKNAMCRVCPQDSGICCPPFTDCGSDGHCPWVALEGCGYAKFGVNLVNMRNSSSAIGMGAVLPGIGVDMMKAPGLPGGDSPVVADKGSTEAVPTETAHQGIALSDVQRVRKRIHSGKAHGHPHEDIVRGGLGHYHG